MKLSEAIAMVEEWLDEFERRWNYGNETTD